MFTLYEKLKAYGDSDYYGFHMPGHKRNPGACALRDNIAAAALPYEIDITEIEGFDDLHHAEGLLKDAQERAARVYHADETHFLINGSTVGILSAIAGTVKKGDTILVARNCHKSVYHAIYMNELNPVYLYPGFDKEAYLNTEISVQDVRDALESHPEIRAVVIVSPTYDGVVSDVRAIADATHEKGVPLIVDEAHGAHFAFHSYFPDNANMKGADLVIHSLHKTLPSLTQTALLHMNGTLVNREKVRKYLHMLQSSSPSYVLMASIDACISLLADQRDELFETYVKRLKDTRRTLEGLKNLQIVRTENYDPSKIVISVKDAGIGSRKLYRMLLDEYHLQMEMTAGTYVLAMTSVGDTEDGFARLMTALREIDAKAGRTGIEDVLPLEGKMPRLEKVYNSAEIERMTEEFMQEGKKNGCIRCMPWEESAGHISTEYAYLYPPGCPLIVPGERITREALELLSWYERHAFSIEGLKRERNIEVWTDG